MAKQALLVVDVQTALVEDGPYEKEAFIQTLQSLLAAARENGVEVLYVQHDGGAGDELEHGARGWQVYEAIAPLPGEKCFEKRHTSSFLKTGLDEYLRSRGIKQLVLCGMQVEYCIDATCKSAFEHGYDVLLPEAGITTFDNGAFTAAQLVDFYYNIIWDGRFGRVLPVEEVIRQMPAQ